METQQTELQLFEEAKIVTPLTEILQEVTPSVNTNTQTPKISQPTKQSLDDLFPEQQYDEKNIKKTKEILGAKADDLSEEELRETMTKIQYLATSWLDDFERKIFDGLTLQELLHEKENI